MIVVRTLKGGTDSFGQLVGPEQPVSLYDSSFAMNPLGLHRIAPGALFGQQAAYDPHPFSTPFDRPVVRVDPLLHFMAYVPACVVPDQCPHLLANRFELLGAPIKKPGGYGAHRTAIDKTQPRLLKLGHIQPVAGDSLRIGIVFGDRLLDETQGFSLRRKGSPSSTQLLREGRASRLHQHSSSKPITQVSGFSSAKAISRSRRLFFLHTRDRGS